MPATTSTAQNELTGHWERTGFVRINSGGYAGRVYGQPTQLTTCSKCGRRRLFLDGPHSPHLVSQPGRELLVLIDCVGDEIE